MFMLLATLLNSNTLFDLIHVIFDHSPSHITLVIDSTWWLPEMLYRCTTYQLECQLFNKRTGHQ